MAYTPLHPGNILSEKLGELGMSAAELAREVHVPANRISQIIAGKRSITADTALRLGKWFGTSPHIWLKLQLSYELYMARQRIGLKLEKISPRKA
ncbi:MAG: addiction module antidote protein, HigA family [Desulfobacteraceae bacterium]|nr:MAG: addiction module antidote protein, HigA family [Desulfobacteraceae bacterium]